jgi:ribosomal protein S18 acetylase RimI-like enzyme
VSFTLRPARPADAPALAQLSREAFVAAFGHLYREEDLAAFLAEHKTIERYEQVMADSGTRIQIAEAEGTLAGYCQLRRPSHFASESDASNPIELQQLYTAPGMTGRGIGAALMAWALESAQKLGCDAVQLSVWSGNFGAQRFYQRYGFAKTADTEFWVGSQCDHEFLFELALPAPT